MQLPLRWLFQFPTVASLAERIDAAQAVGARDETVALQPVPRDRPLPLSFAQQRLWFLTQLHPDSAFYNVALGLRIRGPLDSAALAAAVEALVMRHESLRTVFPVVDDEPVQLIVERPGEVITVVDLSQTAGEDREGAARGLLMGAKPAFDLARDPLFRTTLVTLDALDHVFVLEWHHIVSDGWSTAVIYRDLEELYDACCRHRPPALPELTIQYADYAVWQRQYLNGQRLESLIAFWRNYLAGAPLVLELPTGKIRPSSHTYTGADLPVALSGPLSAALATLSRDHGVTLFMTLMAAFQVLVARSAGRDDVVIGTDVANRNRVELEPLVGFFVNLLPIRIPLSGDPTFVELLARAATSILGVYAHQELPFEKLVEALKPERDLTRNPVVQILFVMQNTEQRTLRLGGTTAAPFKLGNPSSRFDLALFLGEREHGLEGVWRYNADLFAPAAIDRLAGDFEALLASIVANPHVPISALALLSGAESQRSGRPRRESRIGPVRKTRRKAVDLAQLDPKDQLS
jgi:hypothetical protein